MCHRFIGEVELRGGGIAVASQQRDKSFDRIAILVLSIEWVVFGSMHFSMIEDTINQIPFSFEHEFKHHLAIVTGILEVSTGILILVPELRKWAAWATVGLLALLFPAMYNILSEPSSVAELGPMATVFRVALMPNNIFMAICAAHLLRHPDASLARPLAVRAASSARPQRSDNIPISAILAALLLMANCAGFLAIIVGVPGYIGLASLWAMGCI